MILISTFCLVVSNIIVKIKSMSINSQDIYITYFKITTYVMQCCIEIRHPKVRLPVPRLMFFTLVTKYDSKDF